jgi:hypothetical protein
MVTAHEPEHPHLVVYRVGCTRPVQHGELRLHESRVGCPHIVLWPSGIILHHPVKRDGEEIEDQPNP